MPTILGVPKSLIDRGGFRFIGAREANPWTLLEQTAADGTVPVFGDANTLQYSLHKEVGETIDLPGGPDGKRTLKIAGMLDGSVFQGVLLMSEENFRRLFPNVAGYRYFLVEVPGTAANADRLSALLETQLTPYGFEAERVSDRLANFLAVQNTYLSTFQTLGGTGVAAGYAGAGDRHGPQRSGAPRRAGLVERAGISPRRVWRGSSWWRRPCFLSVDW